MHHDEADDDASLVAFADKLAAIQRGDPGVSCADIVHSPTVYDANGNGGSETVNLVPACGASPVPEGAIELKGGVKFIYGAWYVPNEELQKYVASPDAPWLDVVIAGGGYGIMLDRATGTLLIMEGVDFLAKPDNNVLTVAIYNQMLMDYLRKRSTGEEFSTKTLTKWSKQSGDLIDMGLVVKPQ